MKIKLIDRYIYKDLFISFMLILAALNMVVMMERVLKLSRLLANMGATLSDFLKLIVYIQPQLLLLTLPLSCMIAIIITYSRLSTDNEIIIFRVTGMSLLQIATPAIMFGLICFIIGFATSFYLSPLGSRAFREKFTQIFTQKAPIAINQGMFYTFFENMVIFVGEKPSKNDLKNIFIYDNRRTNDPWIIYASSGEVAFYEDLKAGFILRNGRVFFSKDNSSTTLTFAKYIISINLKQPMDIKNNELMPFELLKKSEKLSGFEKNSTLLEFHRRLTFPFTILALMLIAVPLAIISSRSGKMAGAGIGLIVYIIYYGLLLYLEGLSESGSVSNYMSGWMPVVILILVCFYVFNKEARS
ncbi:MAG: LPS export ABC transporter permease LptF [Nitrospirae bacterium]|nr:LPS export ABC transporter permease LptF [Nitrospirota bacterium]MBF0540255.1 LPS export ABC transporter permease LptF [Nitrospirota bacterium]